MSRKTLNIPKPVYIISSASVAGQKEKNGPLGDYFDFCGDDRFGKNTFEKAEAEMQRLALNYALGKSGITEDKIDMMFSGDLVNQCISSCFGLKDYKIPFCGLYGACSTCAEGMIMAALFASTVADRCVSVTSSHYCTAERQFRYPLEYGGQRTPTAQWTVTAAGAFVYSSYAEDVRNITAEYIPEIVDVMPGMIIDRGIKDSSNMGAAMAPSAADTLTRYFGATGTSPSNYDIIITGDLGWEGSAILCDLMKTHSYDISSNHTDCGRMIYSEYESDTHAGGSGCGCSASVMSADILPNIMSGRLTDILFIATGALMNTMSVNQGLSIPGIAHLVHIKGKKKNSII